MKLILIVTAAILVALLVAYVYYGGFVKVEIQEALQGGETIVYEPLTGDYRQTGKVSDSIYYKLKNSDKIATTKGVGIYYDNPQKVATDKLRSEVGCIVDNVDSITLKQLEKKYRVKTLPKQNCVVAEFPFRGKLSVIIAVMKVYPALGKYCENRGIKPGPVIEIYDTPNKKIYYRKEIIK